MFLLCPYCAKIDGRKVHLMILLKMKILYKNVQKTKRGLNTFPTNCVYVRGTHFCESAENNALKPFC